MFPVGQQTNMFMGTGQSPFSPGRDVVYCFYPLLKEYLSQRFPAPTAPGFGLPASLDKGLGALADVLKLAVKSSAVDINDACRRAGWDKVPEETRQQVLAIFGEIFISAHFSGMRDTTTRGYMPQSGAEFCRTVALLQDFSLHPVVGGTPPDFDLRVKALEAENELLQRTMAQLQDDLRAAKKGKACGGACACKPQTPS